MKKYENKAAVKPHPFSLRTKLILSFLLVIFIGGLFSLSIGSRLVKNTVISQAQEKVKYDLAAAWNIFNETLEDVEEIVRFTAAREGIRNSLQNKRIEILSLYLSRIREDNDLDILTLTDHEGRIIVRTRNSEVLADDQSQDEIVKRALGGGVYGWPQIISREELLKEGPDLADQACIKLIDTPKAIPRYDNEETNGLVLKAASAILGEENQILGVLYGGVLINRNFDIVDRVKETVYKDKKYKGKEIGTATIFLQDLRISTNVKNESGERAIGTRVSREVNQAVLVNGESWTDRAFVVNDWYISAYEPIWNINHQKIGILYVGMLESPYIDTTKRVILTFTVMACLCGLLLLGILYFSTTRIINPLKKVLLATQKIAEGNLSHRVCVNSKDELGFLADSFNQMTEDLQTAEGKLIEWGKTLEKKVEERTAELKRAESHLIQSEKLASLGKLAASVAHEINNPLGGILIYSHLLLEDTAKDKPLYDNLEKIVKEATRCKEIVKGLLKFARPKEPEMALTDINETVETSLALLKSQALFQNIKIKKKYSSSLPKIIADSSQLQQVFINIILNAVDVMQEKGTLTIQTAQNDQKDYIYVSFSDTGPGIKEADKFKLFEPFFTTKDVGAGTGLGLSISYSIIQKHHGTIDVKSRIGEGSTFTVKLPANRDEMND